MINFKKIGSLLLCLCFVFCVGMPVCAADSATITLTNKSAVPGDTVTIAVDIQNNPGIMAMAFCITYDSAAFEYIEYTDGYISNNVNNHTDKGHITVTNVANKNNSTNGTILSVSFKVRDTASPQKHKITVANINRDIFGENLKGCFSQQGEVLVIPAVSAGSITVGATCTNSPHLYSDWTVDVKPTCTEKGSRSRTCARCGHIEEQGINPTHDFEADWTVDRAATPEQNGIMSRHCKKCDATTDKIEFEYEEINPEPPESSGDSSADSPTDNPSDTSSNSSSSLPNDSSSDTSSVPSNSSDTSTSTVPSGNQEPPHTTDKPIFNNTVGTKVPLEQVEKLEDYKDKLAPPTESSTASSNAQSDISGSSEDSPSVKEPESTPTEEQNTPKTELTLWQQIPQEIKDIINDWWLVVILIILVVL